VNLMGHSSKQMVYQVYGDYVEDLEDDVDDIIRYFGVDFLIKPSVVRLALCTSPFRISSFDFVRLAFLSPSLYL
jgi:integrase